MSWCNVCDGDEDLESSYREIDHETMLLDTGYENAMNFVSVWNSCGSVDKFLTREDYISVRGTTVRLSEAKECLKTECDVDGVCIEWLDIGKEKMNVFSEPNEEEDLMDVMDENANFLAMMQNAGKVSQILERDNLVYARGTTVDHVEQDVFLNFDSDVDGCVVELSNWYGVELPLRHITFMKNGLNPIKTFLRKHVDLTKYSASQINDCLGFQLFYEGGWEGWVGIIPNKVHPKVKVQKEIYDRMCSDFFESAKLCFQKKLFRKRDKLRRTLAKNDINEVKQITVLPDDVILVLILLQEALDETEIPDTFTVINFCFRFGEKSKNGVSLSCFKRESIRSVTVHCAVNISSDSMELMWSLAGIKAVIGNRGVLNTCLSFCDCASFQSNLDGKHMDITKELRDVCLHPDKLRFVQCYVDHPHRRPKTRFNPVSGCIAGGMVFSKKTSDAFIRDAKRYISAMESNFVLMDKAVCRIEFVCELAELELTEHANVSNCVCIEKLQDLLTKKPMITPFPLGTSKLIQVIGIWIVWQLNELFGKYSKTGNIRALWKVFQFELSVEKLLWGYPLCFRTHPYSVNLGPGKLGQSRCLTDHLGFLALERWSSCMSSDESIPPCRIWTESDMISDKIKRSVGVHDVLHSGPGVLGRRILHALVKDLYVTSKIFVRFEDFLKDIHSEKPICIKVNGAVTVEQLVDQLIQETAVGFGMVFRSLCELTKESVHDLSTILKAGFSELQLKHFPSIQNYDKHGNKSLLWNWRSGLLEIVSCEVDIKSRPPVLCSAVISQLQIRNLVYESRLVHLRRKTLPWIAKSISKLQHLNLTEKQMIDVLCFISCIALILNGFYVDYVQLQKLIIDMPLNQRRLQDLEIQSKLLLSERVNKFQLFRLHVSIPFRLSEEKCVSKDKDRKIEHSVEIEDEDAKNEEEYMTNRIPQESEITGVEEERRDTYCLPCCRGIKRKWDSVEIEILHDVKAIKFTSMAEGYERYKAKCASKSVQFRTFRAFETKITRL